jgi:hypothetical protein
MKAGKVLLALTLLLLATTTFAQKKNEESARDSIADGQCF